MSGEKKSNFLAAEKNRAKDVNHFIQMSAFYVKKNTKNDSFAATLLKTLLLNKKQTSLNLDVGHALCLT